ncbi:glycosyltransferase family 2 protein [Nodosilinea sp. LEGE 07088]|uniref:glycosyltransferase family 2 protein n=1 Tax=Nodosilinea sp. LEGE 07088 TaxID=2777968 RepID=UPI00187EF6DC|nr:glycosyltransferase family 2 protein [Nodosilinea sp. LEGE 07088]MBE9136715.1 glycosyltransferase family 2 protein [Nodosilinea sp. LEGE 07088]
MAQPFMSAIICTHNRAGYLGAAIASVLGQTYTNYELIVVDNASTDDTRAVVEGYLPHPQLTYIYEGNLGLSTARNRGAALAQGEILAYLDDDAEASSEWLKALAVAFEQHPQAAIAGGYISLVWPPHRTPPGWLSSTLAESLGAYDLGSTIQTITNPGQTPRGLNYAVKKAFLTTVGGFDPQLGRVGNNLLSNEELHLTQQALAAGYEVLFVPQAQVAHNVAPERLHRGWFLRRSWWQGISECYREQLAQSFTLGRVRGRGMSLLRGLGKALRHWSDPALRFENLVYAYGQLGYLTSCLNYLRPRPGAGS